jgi:F-type H+-transporting ATPase subunit epsilon
MNGFSLTLFGTARTQRIDGVQAFVGLDASGLFGLRAGHESFMTVLAHGLHRYQRADGSWVYLALPGGLARFTDNRLRISCQRFLEHDDYRGLVDRLDAELRKESAQLAATRASVHNLERELLQRLLKARR